MRNIYGKEIGTTIDFHKFGGTPGFDYQVKHPWPVETTVSAGAKGVVFVKGGGTYSTMFMEVYPPDADFIRGEGATPEECEDSCWQKYQRALNCPSGGPHEWEPRNYRNGAGFCKHCGTFKSQAFTGEELGQRCHECGVGTTWSWEETDGVVIFGCEDHPIRPAGSFKALFDDESEEEE